MQKSSDPFMHIKILLSSFLGNTHYKILLVILPEYPLQISGISYILL
jgi:hypothetical protein